jgi:polyphosphate glucokinase
MVPGVSANASASSAGSSRPAAPTTLVIEIGGSVLKAMLLDSAGRPASERLRVVTPAVPTPEALLSELDGLRRLLTNFDRASVGFPGVVKCGATFGAVHLHPLWAKGFPLQEELEKRWKKPVRVSNDTELAGYDVMRGRGVELVLTLGDSLGSALFTDGHLCPGLDLGRHPWHKRSMSYEDCLGHQGLDRFGQARWNEFLAAAIQQTAALFNWDRLYLGGGNASKIVFTPGRNVSILPSETGLLGGVMLWRDQG